MHPVLEKGRDLMLSISDTHHTVWQICNDRAMHPKQFAVSADEHGALSLLQKALQKRITLFLSSGTGLTSEGAHFQRILQLCLAREFREGNDSLIRQTLKIWVCHLYTLKTDISKEHKDLVKSGKSGTPYCT